MANDKHIVRAFIKFRERFHAQSTCILLDADTAEDVLQNAFYKLYARNYHPESERDAVRLIATTVRNESISELRRRKRLVRLSIEDVCSDEDTEDREALYRDVERQMDIRLNGVQKYIIRRKEYEGATLERIAEELGMQAPAVRMQLSRARKVLREAIRNEHE